MTRDEFRTQSYTQDEIVNSFQPSIFTKNFIVGLLLVSEYSSGDIFMINVNNDSINGIVQGFSSSNEIMSYRGSNTRIGITTEKRNKQSITKKL